MHHSYYYRVGGTRNNLCKLLLCQESFNAFEYNSVEQIQTIGGGVLLVFCVALISGDDVPTSEHFISNACNCSCSVFLFWLWHNGDFIL